MKKKIYLVLTVIFAAIAVIAAGLFIRGEIVKKKAQDAYDKLAETVTETAAVETETEIETETEVVIPSLIPEKSLDWDALHEENEDIYAWIEVPGTVIEYPVLQHPTDDNYYLNRNLDGSTGYPGCIYTQSLNSKDFTDFNTVLYGHNMKNGTMFAGLHEFEDNAFFEENAYIYVYTEEKAYAYEIFAAYEFNDSHLLYAYDYSSDIGRLNYIDDIMNIRDMNAHYRETSVVDTQSNILTLSTCIKGKSNKRYLVQGVMVEEKALVEATANE